MGQIFAHAGDVPDQVVNGFAYWRGLHEANGIPSRRDLDPVQMRRLLPYVFLLEEAPHPSGTRDLRYRLVGEHLIQSYGLNFSGDFLGDHVAVNPSLAPMFESCFQVMETGEPRFQTAELLIEQGYITTACGVLCPLMSESDRPDGVFGVAHYSQQEATLADIERLEAAV